jgi:glyoxylase-like metal-dependent hydrolase (beta-lactamase superfamily II)
MGKRLPFACDKLSQRRVLASRAMREIVPGILTWPQFSERFGYDFNGHLVRHGDGNLAIDPVEPDAATLTELVREGVARIVLTNRNHFRAAAQLAAATGARVAVHPADATFVRDKGVRVDDELVPGERLGPFGVVAAAGKSPGEVALYWPERRLLIVGDACVGNPPGRLSLLPDKVMDQPPVLRQSLRDLAANLDFDTLLVGDGESILTRARAALQSLVATFDGSAPTPVSQPRG